MGIFDPDEVITSYSIKQAIEDKAVIEVFKDEWDELSRGKPIVASMNVFEGVSERDLVEIWNRFVFWRKFIMPKVAKRERLFSMEVNHMMVWVIDYRVCFMMMYPEDY
jgi:hypothetical protein